MICRLDDLMTTPPRGQHTNSMLYPIANIYDIFNYSYFIKQQKRAIILYIVFQPHK